jgi:hypothetical protein
MNGTPVENPFSLKVLFYRFCFFLGLGTATYCSYAQVSAWVNPVKPGSAPGTLVSVSDGSVLSQAPIFAPFFSSPVQAPASEVKMVSSGLSVAAATASPSATPEVSPTPAEAQAGAEGGPAIEAPLATGEPLPNYLNSAYGYPVPQAGLRGPAQEGRSADAPNAASAPAPVQAQGMFLTPPARDGGSSGSGGFSGLSGSTGGTSSSTTVSVLSAQDLSALSTPLFGLLPDQEVTVSGLFCASGLQGRGCSHEGRMTVHTSRFTLGEGLHEQATVSFSGSGVSDLELAVSLKIQDVSGKDSTLSASVRVSEVRVRNETREGKSVRVLELKTPDIEIRPGDHLRKVVARIVLDSSSPGEVLFSPESSLSFSRKAVATSPLVWNFQAPHPVSPTDPALIADEINYSMSIEKSR